MRELVPTVHDIAMLLVVAVITGFSLALAVGVVVGMLGHPHPWKVGAVVFAVCQAGTWAVLVLRWNRLLDSIELATGVDWNRDGKIGGGSTERHLVKVEVTEPVDGGGRSTSLAELPVPPAKLAQLGAGILAGVAFSEPNWTGAGHPFSRGEFRQLRQVFLNRGWMQWNREDAPTQGVSFTAAGIELMREFSSMASTPPTLSGRMPSQGRRGERTNENEGGGRWTN